MNTSFLSKTVTGMSILVALTLGACAKKDDSGSGRIADRSGAGIVSTQNTCANPATQSEGKIFDSQASYGSRFEEQVKAFVSATLDPKKLGTISGDINAPTGVDFTASFAFDSKDQLVAESSVFSMEIFDSYAKQIYEGQTIPPYVVSFTQAKSGSINRNTRQFSVEFEDEFGSITFSGTFDGTYASGKVTFNNYQAVSGSPQAGELGDFKIFQCALIK